MRYGMPYKGSKNSIAREILSFLPSGKRLVDLFGGGGAISHCAMLSDKWDSVLYNEINPVVADTFRKATSGYYRNFKPEWISREEFNDRKSSDGYIRLCWSFGNNGCDYLYGSAIADVKHSLFEYVVNGIKDESIKSLLGDWDTDKTDWHQRYDDVRNYLRSLKKRFDLQSLQSLQSLESLERLERLESLERLQSLERLERLQITTLDYREYEYQDGDVVYCDPPYEGTNCGSYGSFDSKAFYDWVASRPYQVFFSSYEIDDNRFHRIWEREKVVLSSSVSNSKKRTECLYSNEPYLTSLLGKQLTLDL